MICPRCGKPMRGGICDNCGFPMRRARKIISSKTVRNVRWVRWIERLV